MKLILSERYKRGTDQITTVGQITQAEDHPGKIRAKLPSKLVTFNFMRKFSNDAPRTSPLSIYCAEWQAVE
jgi:hypothetical protein